MKHSIYVHPDHLHRRHRPRLLPTLIEACAAAGYRQMIGYIDGANAGLAAPARSPAAFAQVGLLPSVGYKFGHWSDSVMVQRALGSGGTTAPDVWPTVAIDDSGQ